MKLLFAGTPDFACASLKALLQAGLKPCAVLTQPDRAAGRGRKLTASPVKELALAHDLPLLTPRTLKDPDVLQAMAEFDAELLIVVAYGLLLPQAVLDLPRHGCLNVHASLLPRWRGAAPIQAAILAGDAQTGVSLMRMDAGLDTGPVYLRQTLSIDAEETAGELHDRLAELGAAMLTQHLASIVGGSLTATPQDEAEASYAGKIESSDAVLDWRQPAAALGRRVRAYNPVPGAWFELDGERVKCWSACVTAAAGAPPGTVLAASASGVDVACSDGTLRMLSLQRPGRQRVSAAEFAAQKTLPGKRLG